jgi:hypothetical protein
VPSACVSCKTSKYLKSIFSDSRISTHLSLSNVLEQGEKLLGIRISINAVLAIRDGEAYLVEFAENAESVRRVPIHCPNLELELDQDIGAWMGSDYSYIDTVHIVVILEYGTARKNKLVFSKMDKLTLVRDGESTNISFVTGNSVE